MPRILRSNSRKFNLEKLYDKQVVIPIILITAFSFGFVIFVPYKNSIGVPLSEASKNKPSTDFSNIKDFKPESVTKLTVTQSSQQPTTTSTAITTTQGSSSTTTSISSPQIPISTSTALNNQSSTNVANQVIEGLMPINTSVVNSTPSTTLTMPTKESMTATVKSALTPSVKTVTTVKK